MDADLQWINPFTVLKKELFCEKKSCKPNSYCVQSFCLCVCLTTDNAKQPMTP